MRSINSYLLSFIVCISILLIDIQLHAQGVYANGSIDKDSISVGQPFNYKIDLRIPEEYSLDWTELKDTLSSSIEIIKVSDITKTADDNSNDLIVSQTLTLTSFDTGYVEIPKIGLRYSKSAKDTNILTCYTKYMDIYVKPVVIDTTTTYKPIKMPMQQSITFAEILPYASGIIIIIGLIILVLYLIHRAKNKIKQDSDDTDDRPQIPAIITARDRLAQLKESDLCQSGRLKEYYTELTDITREYLEGQFGIEAVEMTSDEILENVRALSLSELTFRKLQETLFTADLVKFAKALPNSMQNEKAFGDINSFVEESYEFHQELEKKKAEEAKSKKYDFENDTTEQQEKEEIQ